MKCFGCRTNASPSIVAEQGLACALQAPEAAIPPEEDAVSIEAAMTIRSRFAQDGREQSGPRDVLFDAILGLLTGGDYRH